MATVHLISSGHMQCSKNGPLIRRPRRFSETTAASFADLVTSPFIASSTVMVRRECNQFRRVAGKAPGTKRLQPPMHPRVEIASAY